MSQTERDRLVALKKAKKKLITQKQAAEELGVTERQVRRLLQKLRRKGDQAVTHGLRGRARNRKLPGPSWSNEPSRCFPTRCTGDLGQSWQANTCTSCASLR